jgi:hypothetical protein
MKAAVSFEEQGFQGLMRRLWVSWLGACLKEQALKTVRLQSV